MVTIIMAIITYLYTIRELEAKRAATEEQINRIAQNIATLQLLDRQDWDVYQNYISQLMAFNQDIVYIAIYDHHKILRAFTLNRDLIDLKRPRISRWEEARIVRRLDAGGVAAESRDDFRIVRVNIQMGNRILGSVHVGFSLIDINDNLRKGIVTNILLALGFIVVFSALSFYTSGRLVRPLEKLSAAMRSVRKGNLDLKIHPTTHDEIAQLTEDFNQMVDALRERRIIDKLGFELTGSFQLESLVSIIYHRLFSEVDARDGLLYLTRRPQQNTFAQLLPAEREYSAREKLVLSPSARQYLQGHPLGFRLRSAPKEIQRQLHISGDFENALIIPLVVKENLLGLFFLESNQPGGFTPNQRQFLVTLANQVAVSLENALLYEEIREQERIKKEIEIARKVQQRLLPREMPRLSGFEIEGFCIPATEVGGDYFDFFLIDPEHLGIVIADVCGKGASASFYMAELKGMMQSLTSTHRTPGALLKTLNAILYESLDPQVFVTLVYAVLHLPTSRITFCRAGHNPPLKIGPNGHFQFLEPAGLGIGLDAGNIFNQKLEESVVSLQPQETLIFYTDGITEARGPGSVQYGEERLIRTVHSQKGNLTALKESILADLHNFLGQNKASDDMTMVMLRKN